MMVLRNLVLDPSVSYMSDCEDSEIPIDLSKKDNRNRNNCDRRDEDGDGGSSNNYIPLSKIHTKSETNNNQPTEILSKRARLDSLISQIKSKPTSNQKQEEEDEEGVRITHHHNHHTEDNIIQHTNTQQYPPWIQLIPNNYQQYLNPYFQIIQALNAEQILRQYRIQNTSNTNNNILQDKIVGGYGCSSPCSARSSSPDAAMSSGELGLTPGSSGHGGHGKRAPRAMTGRHVRTGTGASPSTLQTLRLKIQERQRLKEQGKINQENKGKNKKDSKKRK